MVMEFPAEFFQDEIRCGFQIPVMMKRAWAAECEVLQVVAEVCERNGLQWFADWGTALGAIRHKGFIPWDDDIDICLKREDYQEFIRIAPQELPAGFVLTGMYADSDRLREAADCLQIRVIADEEQWDVNEYMMRFHGFPYWRIGIDIFPLDYFPRDPDLVDLQKEILKYVFITLQEQDQIKRNGEWEGRLRYIEELCAVTIPRDHTTKNHLWKLIDSLCCLHRAEEADEVTEYMYLLKHDTFHMKKEWFQEMEKVPFEHFEIAVPCGWHEVLTTQFGDYMKPSRMGGSHNYPFYGHMEEELVRQIRAARFSGTVEEFCRQVSSGEFRI